MDRGAMIALAEQMTQVTLNRKELGASSRFWNSDMAWRGPLGLRAGVDDFVQTVLEPFFRAFPDYHAVNEVWVVDEGRNLVASWGHFTATHSDVFCGVPATGKHVNVRFMDIWRVSGDKLQENWVQVDHAAFLDQVGAIVLSDGANADETGDVVRSGHREDEGRSGAPEQLAEGIALEKATEEIIGRIFRAGGPDLQGQLWRKDTVVFGPYGLGVLDGAAQIAEGFAGVRARLSDPRVTAELWVTDEVASRIAVWGHLHGRHTGPLLGIPATGGPVEVSYMAFCEFDDTGLLKTCRFQTDTATFLRDAGVLDQFTADALQREAV